MVRGILGGVVFEVGFLVVCEWRGFGVSLGVDFGGCWFVLVIWGLGMVLEVVWWRVPRSALKYIELVWLLHWGVAGFSFWAGRADCGLRFNVVTGAVGC